LPRKLILTGALTFAVLLASAPVTTASAGSPQPSLDAASPCSQPALCSGSTRAALTQIVRNGWDQATDAQRQLFAATAPSVFSSDELVGLFDDYPASSATAAATSPSTIQSPVEPSEPAIAAAAEQVSTQAALGCTIRDRWGSYQFVGGSHDGEWEISASTQMFGCPTYVLDTCVEQVGRRAGGVFFPKSTGTFIGFGFCNAGATDTYYLHNQPIAARTRHSMLITRPKTVWRGNGTFCAPFGTPVTVCRATHNYRVGGGGQKTYTATGG